MEKKKGTAPTTTKTAPTAFLPTSTASSSSKGKNVDDDILQELMKGISELKVEMNTFKRDAKSSTLQPTGVQKGFVARCI